MLKLYFNKVNLFSVFVKYTVCEFKFWKKNNEFTGCKMYKPTLYIFFC